MTEQKAAPTWTIWADTGGTFTDCIGFDPKGQRHELKILSSGAIRGRITKSISRDTLMVAMADSFTLDLLVGYQFTVTGRNHQKLTVTAANQQTQQLTIVGIEQEANLEGLTFELSTGEEAPVLAARLLTATPYPQPLPRVAMRLGTTKGTNALLEQKGAPTLLLITEGFADLLHIGDQTRPDLFALSIDRGPALFEQAIEVPERINAQGQVQQPLTPQVADTIVKQVQESGCVSVAIALMHSYCNPQHENLLASRLQAAGIKHLSLSAQLSSAIKLLYRAQTAVVDAYLAPIMKAYITGVHTSVGNGTLQVMTSAGGLNEAAWFNPKDSLLSGPAGGVVGAAHIAQQCGFNRVLTLDMGGTSTDVSRYDHSPEYRYTLQVGHARLVSQAVAIETVAAGGGSICTYHNNTCQVGPDSAGAHPGPACYGAGGPLTISDINLLLGRIDAKGFGIPLQPEAAEKALTNTIGSHHNNEAREALLEGYLQIANETMAAAISKISVSKGYDPTQYALLAFGGAGGQHACAVADILGIERIVIPAQAGLLSAYGIGKARIERFAHQELLQPLAAISQALTAMVHELTETALNQLASQGYPREQTEITACHVFLRLAGQDTALEIPYTNPEALPAAFEAQYRKVYGHWVTGRTIEAEAIKVTAATRTASETTAQPPQTTYTPAPQHQKQVYFGGQWQATDIYQWQQLLRPAGGATIHGPALLLATTSTTVIEPGWQLTLYGNGHAVMQRTQAPQLPQQQNNAAVQLALFTNRFRTIAEEMGALLQRTAFSVNVKERLDFSCALLDAQGRLVANAPHIPVHLGSLGICTRLVAEALPLQAGDVAITNHPGFGGSHLPDITLVAPVFYQGKRVGYVANRAHHAEMGGTRPGSMPPNATNLQQEGVVIAPTYLVRNGTPQWAAITDLLAKGPYPSRNPAENLADLEAALAAIHNGTAALKRLCGQHGPALVTRQMDALRQHAAHFMKQKLQQIPQGHYQATEYLDDGTPLCVSIAIEAGKANISFKGSGPVHPGNFNANPAIVNSVVMYVLRILIDEDLPMNEGLLAPVSVTLPECLLNPPFPDDHAQCPAVVGGNTETSQRLTDTLLKALGMAACSQGTMNNLLFGNDSFGYYETIGGGTGAGQGFHGQHAVHHHMTNTRITDPEVLEHRYPVQVVRFGIRANSGGQGLYIGGNGTVRHLKFLAPVALTLLTQHRKQAPYGLAGGSAGLTGQQWVIRANGKQEPLEGTDGTAMAVNDELIMLTPGGGGYGTPKQKTS